MNKSKKKGSKHKKKGTKLKKKGTKLKKKRYNTHKALGSGEGGRPPPLWTPLLRGLGGGGREKGCN